MTPTFLVDKANFTFQGRCFIFISGKEVDLPHSHIMTSEVFDNFSISKFALRIKSQSFLNVIFLN